MAAKPFLALISEFAGTLLTFSVVVAPTWSQEPTDVANLKLWATAVNLRGGGGYKDNVLLSSMRPEASAFTLAGLEFSAMRLPIDGTDVSFLFSAEDRRFLDAPDADKEQWVLANATLKRQLSSRWTLGLAVQYLYMDQVFDASTTEYALGIVRAHGHVLTGRPSASLALGRSTWFEIEFPVGYSWFAEPLDDYIETGPRFAIRHTYGHRSEFEFSYQVTGRSYATRQQASAGGELLSGSSLAYEVQRAEASWRHHWDQARHWRTAAKVGLEANHDNGPGYFDYTRCFGGLQLRYRSGAWECSAQAGVGRYDYAVQTASPADPDLRRKILLTAVAHAEKRFSRHLKLFADYEYEQSLANWTLDSYQVNTVFGGAEWEF